MHVIKSNEDVPMQPAIQPIQRKRVDLKFKVMGQKPAVQGGEGATPLAMEVEITPVASHVQLKVTITNITNHPVENVVLKFLVEGRVMLARTQPPNYRLTDLEDGITIPSIPAQGYRRVLFYFSPLECKPVEIFVLLQYNDEDGIFKDEHVSQRIDLSIPEFIPKEKPIDEIEFQQLVHSLAFKAMKSFAMPSAIESSKAYLLVKEILLINQFELVGEKFNEDDGNFLGWYYTKVKGISSDVDDFIIIGQILNSKIEFFGMGNGASILLCACTHFANSLRQELVSRHVIAKDVELIELFCPTCGGTLSRSPVQGELYTCKFCGAKMQF